MRIGTATSTAAGPVVQVYISTGPGAVNQLPNGKVEAILSRMRPPLRAAEYDEAVEQAVVDIGLGLAGQGGHVPWPHIQGCQHCCPQLGGISMT